MFAAVSSPATRGATRILRTPLAAWRGRLLGEVPGLEVFAKEVQAQFSNFLLDAQSEQAGPMHGFCLQPRSPALRCGLVLSCIHREISLQSMYIVGNQLLNT